MDTTDRLVYKRQYMIGPRHAELPGWNVQAIGQTHRLLTHPDLQTEQVFDNARSLTLIGFMLDPRHPKKNHVSIMKELLSRSSDFETLLENLKPMSGRWVVVWTDGESMQLCHDPCGMRQVYYTEAGGACWIASQPTLLAEYLRIPEADAPDIAEFVNHPAYERKERMWPGDGSRYRGIKHLLPNHALDVAKVEAYRYWPTRVLPRIQLEDAVKIGVQVLEGTMEAAAHRYDLMMPVTAGVDSRVLLAASRKWASSIYYYVSRHSAMEEEHEDVRIPLQLFGKLGLDFEVRICQEQLGEEFRQYNQRNASMRDLPKASIIYDHYLHSQNRMNLSGNCSEIGRDPYFMLKTVGKGSYNSRQLAELAGYKDIPYAIEQYDKWLQAIAEPVKETGIALKVMFYWEQRLGNWGSMYAAEQDIACEELCVFNNRAIFEAMLSVEEKYRLKPGNILHKKLIQSMWPETLVEPFNPATARRIKEWIKSWARGAYVALVKLTPGRARPGSPQWPK